MKAKPKVKSRRIIIHPFLLPLFPLLSFYDHNKSELLIGRSLVVVCVLAPLILACLSLSFWSLLSFLIKDKKKAALVVSLSLWLFCSYGYFYSAVESFHLVKPNLILCSICAIVFLLGTWFSIRTPRELDNFTGLLNWVSVFLVVIPLINVGTYTVKRRLDSQPIRPSEVRSSEDTKTSAAREKPDVPPDIYYVILDRYASASTLKEFYNYDNQEFIDYLSRKGFYCAPESTSNYLTTAHSLASSLNMEFINYLSERNKNSDDLMPLYGMLQDYSVWRFLKSKGYKFIHFGSWWHPTSRNHNADMNFNWHPLPEFAMDLIGTTLFFHVVGKRFGLNQGQVQRRRVPFVFDQLAEVPKMKESTFVFVHMLIPHPPYVFDRNGHLPGHQAERTRGRIANYVDQLVFTNKKLKLLIDSLLSDSPYPPVIILQGDEGPYPERFEREYWKFNWKGASGAEFREKMRILNAYYLPKTVSRNSNDGLYPSITPVNSFRVIFNVYFNEHLRLLPDERYAYQDKDHPYDFFEVTEKVMRGPE
jgi:hypothetical protein